MISVSESDTNSETINNIKMKKVFTLLMIMCVVGMIQAQDNDQMKTLFSRTNKNGHISHGGYGAFSVGYTQIDKQDAILIGGQFAWIANHSFALGLAGRGFFNSLDKNYNYDDPGAYSLAGGYGGLLLEPIIMPKFPVHISVPILLGVGGVAATHRDKWDNYQNNNNYYYDNDVFLVFEPGIDIEFNIVKFFRVALGGSYRLTNGVDLRYKYIDANNIEQQEVIAKDALDAFNLNLSLKFGWF